MAKVLLSTIYKPFGLDDEEGLERIVDDISGKFGNEGIFHLRTFWSNSNLHLIADNVDADVVVLEYPSRGEFVDIVSKGGFDYVGVTFIPPTYKKALNMIDDIKRYSPSSGIVLGGYGVLVPEISKLEDVHVCRGDGISFMRELLGQQRLSQSEFQHPILAKKYHFMGVPVKESFQVVVDTGCDEGCEFCMPSHYWKGKRKSFISTAEDIFNFVKKVTKHNGKKTNSFFLISENFASDRQRIKELAEMVESSGLNPRFTYLSTARDIEKIDIKTLLLMGTDSIYIGVESPSNLKKYRKTDGVDIKALFDRLHKYGIFTVGSAMLFSPHHNHDNLQQDIKFMQDLGCALTMFAIYLPGLGTPAYDVQSRSGSLLGLDWRYFHGFHPTFVHPNFTHEEMLRIQRDAEEFCLRTPSIFRAGLIKLRGYRTITQEFPYLKRTLASLRRDIKMISFLIPLGYKFAGDVSVVSEFERGVRAEFGRSVLDLMIRESIKYYGIVYNRFASKNGYYNQPKTKISHYTQKRLLN